MAVTRMQAEKTLVSRAGKRMEFVGMSTTANGSNADLDDPLATALLRMGISSQNANVPTDADLFAVENALMFFDLAELRLLENILGNFDMVDAKVGERSESLSQFAESVEKSIKRLTAKIQREYGLGLGSLEAGVIGMDFQEKHANVE